MSSCRRPLDSSCSNILSGWATWDYARSVSEATLKKGPFLGPSTNRHVILDHARRLQGRQPSRAIGTRSLVESKQYRSLSVVQCGIHQVNMVRCTIPPREVARRVASTRALVLRATSFYAIQASTPRTHTHTHTHWRRTVPTALPTAINGSCLDGVPEQVAGSQQDWAVEPRCARNRTALSFRHVCISWFKG